MPWKVTLVVSVQNSRFEVYRIALELALQWRPHPFEPDRMSWILWCSHWSFDHLMITPESMNIPIFLNCQRMNVWLQERYKYNVGSCCFCIWNEQKFTDLIEDEAEWVGIHARVERVVSVQLRCSVVAWTTVRFFICMDHGESAKWIRNAMIWYLLKLSTTALWLISLTLSGPIFDTLVTPNPAIFRLPPLSRKICLAPYQDSNSKVRDNTVKDNNNLCATAKN